MRSKLAKFGWLFSTFTALTLAGLPTMSTATPVTRQFEFSSTSGALQFGPNLGSFTYDDSVAPAGGGYVFQVGLFSDLNVAFDAFTFDETTANSGWLLFGASGQLLDALFGTNCGAGICSIGNGSPDWWIRVGEPGHSANDFAYSGFNGEQSFHQTFQNRLLPAEVPEPASLTLLGIALAGLVTARRRS